LEGLADEAGDGTSIETFTLDVLDNASVVKGVERANPDILFNCAGFVHHGTLMEATDEEFEGALQLNLRSSPRLRCSG